MYGSPLWSLLVTSYGVALSDKSNVNVLFALNPSAVLAGAFSFQGEPLTLGNYMTFDSLLAGNLKSRLSVVGGEVRLNGYDPFPSTFTYDVTSPIAYASGAGAGFMSVPEPSTWTLMLMGFAGLGYAACLRERRKVATTAAI